MTCGLTRIRHGTASTFKLVYNTRFQKFGNFILKRKERGDACRGTKDKSNVKMEQFLSPFHWLTPFKFAPKSPDLATLLTLFRSSFFPFKDKGPKFPKSGVVYSYMLGSYIYYNNGISCLFRLRSTHWKINYLTNQVQIV